MIQRAGSQPDLAAEIATRILGVVRPWRIVLFGSRARGNHRVTSDYDFYVEVSEEGVSPYDLRKRIQDAIGSRPTCDVKVCAPGEIERRRDDPGTMEWDVAREGRLLYADPAAPQVLAPPMRVGESPAGIPDSLREWIELAEKDMRHCLLLREQNDFWGDICWYSHQTCEKYMRALFVSRRVRPKRTHELGELLAALRASGFELPGLDADCECLSRHAATARYTIGLGSNDAEAAFAAAERILAAVRAGLPPGFR